ncbi:MAG: DUF61 family protein [Candidatus Heimdallarchaeota archaeon]|nr:DUF61 family protein [Candidatus Heimdallarchaeota archaeon]
MSDKLIDLIWKFDIEKMNDHLPAENKSLKELLLEEKPQIRTKKNQTHLIRKKELEIIKQIIPHSEWSEIKLPITILRRTSLEKGLYSVSGGLLELYLVHMICGKTGVDFEHFKLQNHEPYIWKPEAFTAVRKLSTCIIIGYT